MRAESPIFIVGAPRSGTTLLRNMLNRHPAIAICLETQFLNLIYRRRRAFGDLSDFGNRRRLVREYLATERIKAHGVDLQVLEDTLLREGVSYQALFRSFLRFYAQAHGKRRCGEKTPEHALFTGTLRQWFPAATILHILRDPRDVVASLLAMPRKPKSVLTNASTWVRCNLGAQQAREHPGYLLIRYEELVAQPEEQLQRVCAFIGEEYRPEMLTPDANQGPTFPWLQRAQEPVTTERLGKWREQLTADQVALVEWRAGQHMRTFGYEPVGRAPSSLCIGRQLILSSFDSLRRAIGEFPASWYSLIRSANIGKEETARRRFRGSQSI